MKKQKLLAAVLVLMSLGWAGHAAIVSSWNFDSHTNDGWNVYPDQVGTNTGRSPSGTVAHGTGEALSVGNSDYQGLYAPKDGALSGFTTDQGTFTWSYRKTADPIGDFCPMLATQLLIGANPEPFSVKSSRDATWLYFDSGPYGEIKIGTTSLFDGNWHTLKLTYADGQAIKLYMDNALIITSGTTYSALDTVGQTSLYLGRLGYSAHFAGEYDDFSFDNAIPEPATLGLLALGGGWCAFRRRRR